MNKIKLLYDVVKTMQAKETLNGVAKVAVKKDQANIFSMQNEFAKNTATGQTKAKICTELDYEGKKVKHESTTEFSMPESDHDRHHEFFKHMHMMHQMHHQGPTCCGGIKGKLAKLSLALGLLNSLEVVEQDNKGTLISLNLNELPEEMKACIRERMQHHENHHQHEHEHEHHGHGFLKEFFTMEKSNFSFKAFVNKNYEVEKMLVTIDGTKEGQENAPCAMQLQGEIALNW